MLRLASLCVVLVLSGCAYNVSTPVTPAMNVYSSYEDRIPGTFILVIDDSLKTVNNEVKPSSFICSAHKFPVMLGNSLAVSVERTMQSVFETVMAHPTVPPDTALEELGATGVIVVRLDHFQPRITFREGFWSASCDAASEISLGVQIRGKTGVLFGGSAGASRMAQGDAGPGCSNGASILSDAIQQSIRETMERLAEKISNSTKLREYAGKART